MKKPKNWGQPCPNPDCSHYRLMDRGNIRAISTYMTRSGKRRIFRCNLCQRTFSETQDTVFFDLRTPEEKVMMALKMILVRVDLSGICFVLGVTEETVLEWLRRASQKAQEINEHLLRELPVTQVQLDEMWSFIKRKHSQQASPDGESPDPGPDRVLLYPEGLSPDGQEGTAQEPRQGGSPRPGLWTGDQEKEPRAPQGAGLPRVVWS